MVVAVTDAVFVIVPAVVAITVISIVADPAEGMSPGAQVTTPPASLHPAEADTNVTPAGSASVTIGATAVSGPVFATVTV